MGRLPCLAKELVAGNRQPFARLSSFRLCPAFRLFARRTGRRLLAPPRAFDRPRPQDVGMASTSAASPNAATGKALSEREGFARRSGEQGLPPGRL